MATLINPNLFRALDANGDPVAGAKAYFYDTGTTTEKTVYSDTALTTVVSQPLVADAQGTFSQVFFAGGTVKVNVTDADDVQLNGYPLDPAPVSQNSTQDASDIVFVPTASIAQTNVQDAIEQVQTNIGSAATYDFTSSDLTFTDDQIPGASVADATSTSVGVVELATIAEARAGTSTSVVPTVARVVNVLQGQEMDWQFWENAFDFTTDGAQETVTTSELEDYYEYAVLIRNLSHNSGSSQTLKCTCVRASDDGGDAAEIGGSIGSSADWNGPLYFTLSRNTGGFCWAQCFVATSADLNVAFNTDAAVSALNSSFSRTAFWTFATNTKVKQFKFETSAGVNFDKGRIDIYRKLAGSP